MYMLHFISHHVGIRCLIAMYLSERCLRICCLFKSNQKKNITHQKGCLVCVICGCSGSSGVCCVESACDHAFRE